MKRVTIEITERGWNLKATVNGREFNEEGVLTETGSSHKGDNLDEMEWMKEELYDALESFFCYNIAKALSES